MSDNWKNRSSKMQCKTCMHYCNKRCRRHAPTMQGFPPVYETDWCGDHKIDKEMMVEENAFSGFDSVEDREKFVEEMFKEPMLGYWFS